MWLIFGAGAVIALVLNLMFISSRKADVFRFVSISLTALTVCSFYAQNKDFVLNEDWGALMDVVPATSTALWVLVIASILVNSVSLIKRK